MDIALSFENSMQKAALEVVNHSKKEVEKFSKAGEVAITAIHSGVSKYYSDVKKEISSVIAKSKERVADSKLFTKLALTTAPNKEAYLQILTQNASYNNWEIGSTLPKSEFFDHANYRVKKIIEYRHGLRALLLTSDDPEEAPLMVFRGTYGTNIHNLADDVNLNAGELNYTRYRKQLEKEIEQLAIEHGRIHIMGHSYGGAMAQLLTSKYPQFFKRCTYYNALSVGEKAVREFNRNVAKLPHNMPKPEVWSYRHAKDVPSLLGGASLPTTEGRNYTHGTHRDYVSHIDAHSFNTLSTGARVSNGLNASSPSLLKNSEFFEKGRREIGRVIPFYKMVQRMVGDS